ncbi:MAG TPA: ComF family protein [Burkholderiaceae bacterium]|nr:ComF family protein [Burkholderiaceae bacterium]
MPLHRTSAPFAWPTQCVVCRGWGRERLCRPCRDRHAGPAVRCRGCALAVPAGIERCGRCLAQPLPFARVDAAVDYAFPWSTLVARLKFHAAVDLADALAAQMAARLRVDAATQGVDLVLPLPLGRLRLAERGMNQAWELARRLARQLGLPAQAGLLERRVDTPHLADLPREARAAAIRGAFALAPGASGPLRGSRVALVDDVMTTGATAAEAAQVLLDGGADAVHLWVYARTPAPAEA